MTDARRVGSAQATIPPGVRPRYAAGAGVTVLPIGPFVPEEAPGLIDALRDVVDQLPDRSHAKWRASQRPEWALLRGHEAYRLSRVSRCLAREKPW